MVANGDSSIVLENVKWLAKCMTATALGTRSGLGRQIIENLCTGRNLNVTLTQLNRISKAAGLRTSHLFDENLRKSFHLFLPRSRDLDKLLRTAEEKYLLENRYKYPLLGVYKVWPLCGFKPEILQQWFETTSLKYSVCSAWRDRLLDFSALRHRQWTDALKQKLPNIKILVSRPGFGALLRKQGAFQRCDGGDHRSMLEHIVRVIAHADVEIGVIDAESYCGPDTVSFKNSVMTFAPDLGFRWRDGARGHSRRCRLERLQPIFGKNEILADVKKALAGSFHTIQI